MSSIQEEEKETSGEQPVDTPRAVVGIGASAGGLETFGQFFAHIPADTGMAFILITHLDPAHKGILPELVQRFTTMPVTWAEDGMVVRQNTVYVKPANADLAILHGTLVLLEPVAARTSRTPVDLFFRHLADDQNGKAVGIILSGMGHDGTLGVRAIKERMGIAMAQDPFSALYGSMPESAIATGLVDYVAPAEDLPHLLIKYIKSIDIIARVATIPVRERDEGLMKVFALIRSQTGQDFSQYRQSTILRRVERRMGLHQLTRIEDYVRYLQENPAEIKIMAKELLIGVTRFFRDPDAWQALQEKAIRDIAQKAPDGSVIRAWVPGCSTGEEAYTLAIVLHECLDALDRYGKVRCQIFATDLDPEAIEVARRGRYIPTIEADVSPERLKQYFVKEGDHYRIRQEIRETIVFARQNLIADPPFTHMDILCCRNLLIYLSPGLQKKVIPLFHYALKPGGALFLGTAETIGSHNEHFRTVDGRWKIFRRRETSMPIIDRIGIPISFTPQQAGSPGVPKQRHPTPVEEFVPRLLIERFVPPTVVVNENGDVLYFHGKTGKYLELPRGRVNVNIYAMAREGLSYPLITALRSAKQEKRENVTERVSVKTNGDSQQIRLTVTPIEPFSGSEDLFMVVFEDVKEIKTEHSGEEEEGQCDIRCRELERELSYTRAQFQSTFEEMQASQEEQKAMSEEFQSTNEELQSTNEELTTSKEELQSLNEELLTVNTELQAKISELSSTTDDMHNLLRGADIAMLFLDKHLQVRRFTEPITGIINLRPNDLGRPIADLVINIPEGTFIADVGKVLDTLNSMERQVQTADGRWYQMRILPYRTSHDQIDGVVATFVDITPIKEFELRLREARVYAENIVETVREPLVVLDEGFKVISANKSFYQTFRVSPEESEGEVLFNLGNRQWDIPELRRLLEEVLPGKMRFEGFEMRHEFPGIGQKVMRLSARRIPSETGSDRILFAIEDVTGQAGAEAGETGFETGRD